MSGLQGGVGLRGRRRECDTLDRLLADVRAEQSRALVVRGEAGIGKTALLEYLAARATGCRVMRAAGVESEMELAFAGVHQLCAPLLVRLPRLPGPQRDAIATAFGLSAGDAPDRFLVGLAVLGLLSDAAAERPLVCLIDDAQWLDRASAQVLAFVARRLLAESVALVFGVRDPDDGHADGQALAGLPELAVAGLGDEDARALLDSVLPGRLDERVQDRLVAEAAGNPLALLELPRGFTIAEMAGGFALPEPGPLASRIEQCFVRQLHALPGETRRLLLTAAAEPVGDVPLLWRAAARLGVGSDAAAPAEAVGLLELGARVRFRHPLLRAAAYRAAEAPERQAVHRALADATDPDTDPDRRAWHRAHAATGPDEAVAGELEQSSDRARCRGGLAAAAAFLRRATELTPDPGQRAARALAAAQATFDAGAPDAADELLAAAAIGPLDDLHRARLARLRGQIVFARRLGGDALPLLLDAARLLEPLDGRLAREAYLEAFGAALLAGRLHGAHIVREVAEAARTAPPAREPVRASDLLLDGLATRYTDGYAAAVPPLRQALSVFLRETRGSDDVVARWTWPWIWQAILVARDLWDEASWNELSTCAVGLAREAGALTVLPIVLGYRASVHLHAGEFAAATALIEEADGIIEATGNAPFQYASMMLTAWRGDEVPALQMIEARVRDATASGEGRAIGMAGYATAVLYNGLGRYDAALAGARQACEYEDLVICGASLVELVEAGARSGADAAAADALRRLEEWTQASGTDWALGVGAQSRALLSDGPTAEALYREAIERLGRSRIAIHVARAHLLYGEWLRREQRRVDAREQLRRAHDMLARMGAEAFAERARRELLATGETVQKRTPETRDVLTAQEALVARLAAEGRTNPEIGSQLFISPRTAEYHLRKVFTKLGVSSRRALRGALQTREGMAGPA